MIELLTVIPIEEIVEKGIPYIQKNFDVGNYQKQFDIFWEYFINQWMNNTDPTLWNIHMILQYYDINIYDVPSDYKNFKISKIKKNN